MIAFTLACMFTIGFLAGVLSLIALVCYLDAKSDTQTTMVIKRTPVSQPVVNVYAAEKPFKTDILI